jgi:hypothetical protein
MVDVHIMNVFHTIELHISKRIRWKTSNYGGAECGSSGREPLPSKYKALNSNPSTIKKN